MGCEAKFSVLVYILDGRKWLQPLEWYILGIRLYRWALLVRLGGRGPSYGGYPFRSVGQGGAFENVTIISVFAIE